MARYDLLLSGSCRDDVSPDTLRISLLYQLRLAPEQVERLLPPARGVLKRDLASAQAHEWVERLRDTGLDVHLVERQESTPVAQDLDLQARLAALQAAGLPRPAFSLGERLQLLAAVLLGLTLSVLYLLPGLAGLLLAICALAAFITLLHQDIVVACGLALPLAGLGAWLALGFLAPRPGRGTEAAAERPLTPAQEPALHSLIAALCQAMGVCPPRRLLLTAEVDIRFAVRTRTLRLGLPLMTALTRDQYLASLAHVLGHQVSGLDRLGGALLNACLAQLERLGQAASRGLLARVARGWARLLFASGQRLTHTASQRREARADHYQVLLGGSAAFRATARQTRLAQQAWREARRRSLTAPAAQGLVGNLLELHAALLARQTLSPTPTSASSRYWGRHPADRQRIAWAERHPLPGLLDDRRPASALLEQPDAHGRALTLLVHRLAGRQPEAEPAATVATLVPEPVQDSDTDLQRWSGHAWPDCPWLPLHLPLERTTRALEADTVRERILLLAAGTADAWQEAEKQSQRRCLLAFYEELHSHGLAHVVHGEGAFNQEHLQEYRAIDTWQTAARQQLLAVAPLYRQRIERALAQRLPGQEQAAELYRLLLTLAERYPDVERLREARLLVKEYRTLQRRPQGPSQINALCEFAKQDYRRRVADWLACDLPLPPAIATVSLGDYLQRHCPRLDLAEDSLSAVYRHSAELLPALNTLHQRLWLLLARACLAAEADQASLQQSA